jgi:hypothetical protein
MARADRRQEQAPCGVRRSDHARHPVARAARMATDDADPGGRTGALDEELYA